MDENELKEMSPAALDYHNELKASWSLGRLSAEILEKIAKRYGPGKYLGGGSYGKAFLLNDNTVLKLTIDELEAQTSKGLIGKKLKNVVEFYEVLKVPRERIYLIKQEYIPVPMHSDGSFEGYVYRKQRLVTGGGFNSMQRLSEEMRKDPYKDAGLSEDLATALDELRENGVVFHDLHGGNMGKKNGRLYLYDLGLSQSPARGNIEELAHRNEKYSGVRLKDLIGV